MKQRKLTVHCVFSDSGADLEQLLAESFRFYLIRSLAKGDTNGLFYV